jgi:hypothetical protein
MGIKVEMEHTKDKDMAKQIALDHLTEIPDYYTRLASMEKEGKAANAEKSKKKNESVVEENEPKETKKKSSKKSSTPTHTTTKLVNALPIRNGKKMRSEVEGDVRIRYKTFEEKRKEEKERKSKSNSKKKGD